MITLDRLLARQARAVFRKLLGRQAQALGIPLTITASSLGLTLEAVSPQGAARYEQPGSFAGSETLRVPLKLLDDCQSSRGGEVTLKADRPGFVTAQWLDGQLPQSIDYPEVELSQTHAFPELPATWSTCGPELLSALAAAMESCDPYSTRYSPGCILLSGARGRIAATDGRQIYAHSGFSFGWEDDLLLPASSVIGCRELVTTGNVEIGATSDWLMLRTLRWTIGLPRLREGHFPDIDSVLPQDGQITASVRLNPADAEFLKTNLTKLRGDEYADLPLTFDLNGSVAVRCQPAEQSKPLELVLSNSARYGQQVTFNVCRSRLLRALALGLDQLKFTNDEVPVVWQRDNCLYAWAPFSPEGTIPVGNDIVRLASPLADAPVAVAAVRRPSRRPRAASRRSDESRPANQLPVHTPLGRKRRGENGKPRVGKAASGVEGLMQQAEAIQVQLREALLQSRDLMKALRQHRRQSRLMRTTLSSLKQLQGIGA